MAQLHHYHSFAQNWLHGSFYGRHLDLNYFPAAFPSNQKTKVYARITEEEEEKRFCNGAQHGIFWKMLFGLNTVSVLTLIDVPVCFPLLLQTENTHKTGYYRLGGVRQKQPFLQLFADHSLPCLLFFSRLRERWGQKTKVNRWKENERRVRVGMRENAWRMTTERREDFYKTGSQSQFNHPNWKQTCQQAVRRQVSPYCSGMFIRMLNSRYQQDKLWFISQFCQWNWYLDALLS